MRFSDLLMKTEVSDMQLQDIFLQIINMSLMATVIIVAILGIRLLMKRLPKLFSYILWAVVLFRLLCPVSFATELSIFNMLDRDTTDAVEFVVEKFGAEHFVYVKDVVVGKDSKSISGQQAVTSEEAIRKQDSYIKTEQVVDIAKDDVAHVQTEEKKQAIDIGMIAMSVWLGGIAVLMVYSVVQMLILRRNLIGAVPYKENIYYADHISTPFVLGVIRPRIYVPSSLDKSEWAYIIMHEKHHIQRGDHIVRMLAFLALCVHWFNPLVWLAFIQSGKDMEMSCDEAVMRQMQEDIRAEYSESLLRLATGRRSMTAMPLAFGEGDTKGRVKNVMRYKKPTLKMLLGAMVFCVVAVVTLAGNPVKAEEKTVLQEVEPQEKQETIRTEMEPQEEQPEERLVENYEKENILGEKLGVDLELMEALDLRTEYTQFPQASCTREGLTVQIEAAHVNADRAEMIVSLTDAEGSERDLIKENRNEDIVTAAVNIHNSYDLRSNSVNTIGGNTYFLEYDAEADKLYFALDMSADGTYDISDMTFYMGQILVTNPMERKWINMNELVKNPTMKDVEPYAVSEMLEEELMQDGTIPVLNLQEIDESHVNALSITGIGYADGILRVQCCRGDCRWAERSLDLYMVDANGMERHSDLTINWLEEVNGVRVQMDEFLFQVHESELADVQLYGIFHTSEESIKGDWEVTFSIDE